MRNLIIFTVTLLYFNSYSMKLAPYDNDKNSDSTVRIMILDEKKSKERLLFK